MEEVPVTMPDLGGRRVLITGAAQRLGAAIARAFAKRGAAVVVHCFRSVEDAESLISSLPPCPASLRHKAVSCDLADLDAVREMAEAIGAVDFLVNNALPVMKGIEECSWEDFSYALAVGVTAPFYLTKLFAPHFAPGAAVVNISSSRDRMSQPQTESYTAAKGGISALTHALAVSLSGVARVNSISPGWIDTTGSDMSGADAVQQPVGRVGRPEDIADTVLFLCSDKAGFITGENICVDGGMTRLMIYHGDHGWKLDTGR